MDATTVKRAFTASGQRVVMRVHYAPCMTRLSLSLTRALEKGRVPRVAPTRASLLATLLRKRATAQCQGAEDLEAMLRDQIRWSLPIERG